MATTSTSFWAGLTKEQQRAALAYRGPENHGDPAMSLSAMPQAFRVNISPLTKASWKEARESEGLEKGEGLLLRSPACEPEKHADPS